MRKKKIAPPRAVKECRTASEIKAFANPTRLSILKKLHRKKTISEVAEELNVHPANLSHHFKLLEKEKLITLVGKLDTGRNTLKYYQAVALDYVVLTDDETSEENATQKLSILRNHLSYTMQQGTPEAHQEALALLVDVQLLPGDIQQAREELQSLVEKYQKLHTAKGQSFTLNLSLYKSVK